MDKWQFLNFIQNGNIWATPSIAFYLMACTGFLCLIFIRSSESIAVRFFMIPGFFMGLFGFIFIGIDLDKYEDFSIIDGFVAPIKIALNEVSYSSISAFFALAIPSICIYPVFIISTIYFIKGFNSLFPHDIFKTMTDEEFIGILKGIREKNDVHTELGIKIGFQRIYDRSILSLRRNGNYEKYYKGDCEPSAIIKDESQLGGDYEYVHFIDWVRDLNLKNKIAQQGVAPEPVTYQ